MKEIIETPAVTSPSLRSETAGQPLPGTKQSVPDLEEQVAYHRAFEAVVWAIPASAIRRFRRGLYDVPRVEDNVVVASSGTLKTRHEAIAPTRRFRTSPRSPTCKKGPMVVEVSVGAAGGRGAPMNTACK